MSDREISWFQSDTVPMVAMRTVRRPDGPNLELRRHEHDVISIEKKSEDGTYVNSAFIPPATASNFLRFIQCAQGNDDHHVWYPPNESTEFRADDSAVSLSKNVRDYTHANNVDPYPTNVDRPGEDQPICDIEVWYPRESVDVLIEFCENTANVCTERIESLRMYNGEKRAQIP